MPQTKRQHVDAHELRALVEQAPDAYFLHDFSGQIIDVNRRACESLGYTRDELLQLTVLDIEQDFDLDAAQNAWSNMYPGDGTTLAGTHLRKDGTQFPIEARLSVCMVGAEKLYLGLVRDVTERQKAEEALRISAEQYRTLFNSIDEGFCVVEVLFDTAGRPRDYLFLEVNPAFEKHVGLVGAAGKTILELVPGIERKWIDIYGQVALTGHSARFREHSASLEQRSFDVYAFRLGPAGSAQVAILFANITARVAAEDALKRSEQLALIGRMAGVISHEINNPLDSLQNLLYIAEFEKDPEVAVQYIRQAQQEVAAAARIVSNTLNFTRRVQHASVENLADVVDSALTLLDGKRKRAGVVVQRRYRAKSTVLCLSSELRQVFANLIANAYEATPRDGTIFVRVRDARHWATGRPGVCLTIADNGAGMTPETQRNLFQAFYTTKGMNGTGLGLWVSHEILRRHSVEILLRSRQHPQAHGTVFLLWFPLNTEPKAPPAATVDESELSHTGRPLVEA